MTEKFDKMYLTENLCKCTETLAFFCVFTEILNSVVLRVFLLCVNDFLKAYVNNMYYIFTKKYTYICVRRQYFYENVDFDVKIHA